VANEALLVRLKRVTARVNAGVAASAAACRLILLLAARDALLSRASEPGAPSVFAELETI